MSDVLFSLKGFCLRILFSPNMFAKQSTIIITLVFFIDIINAKRGPHHPRGEFIVKRETRKQEFTEHLSHDNDNE